MRILHVSRIDDEPGANRAREQVRASASADILDGCDQREAARRHHELHTRLRAALD